MLFVSLVVAFSACKKGPGSGGTTSIIGKVWVEKWDPDFIVHADTLDYWAMDADVYIIYGDDATYGDRTKTGPGGVFEFHYLREGHYTIYVYSDSPNPGGKVAVIKELDIPGDGTTDIGTLTIKKN